MARFLLGLTGGMASGKSTVARWLEEAGFTVVDADRLVAELYSPGAPGAEAVRRLLGDGVLTPAGGVDHRAVAERVFSDDDLRRRLEEAIHPLVRRRFREIAEDDDGVVVLEATLLVEAGYGPDFDRVLTIEAPEERRLAWAVARGMDQASARARLVVQGDGAPRRRGVTSLDGEVWHNDGSLEDLRRRVDRLVSELAASSA